MLLSSDDLNIISAISNLAFLISLLLVRERVEPTKVNYTEVRAGS